MIELKGFKFVTTLILEFKKIENYDKTKYDTFYLHSEAETIINETDTDDVFKSIYTTIISNIQKIQVGFLIQLKIILLVFQNIIL